MSDVQPRETKGEEGGGMAVVRVKEWGQEEEEVRKGTVLAPNGWT